MQRALAFNRSPPLSVAFRFFLNVPAFLMLAAIGLAWVGLNGGDYIRWNPMVLAVTHFLTLGVLASAMLGAMMQILPVAAHIHVLCARVTSFCVHAGLVVGTLSLAFGFIGGVPLFHGVAMILLAVAFLLFLAAVVGGLIRDWPKRSPGSTEVLGAVRLAMVALATTISLGVYMAGLRANVWSTGMTQAGAWLHSLPNLHVVWGLAGWVGLLVVGISYQVIPIFQATELYPKRLTDTLAPLVFLLLTLVTLSGTWQLHAGHSMPFIQKWGATLLAGGFVVYSLTTTWLLWKRKRPKPEPTTWFWHLAMAALFLAAGLGIFRVWAPGVTSAKQEMLLGTLWILGFGVSAVNGMLYKIVPFLLWHNAQRRASVAVPFMPKVRQFIAEEAAMRQFIAHLCAVVLLAAAGLVPVLLVSGALALAVSASMLAWNMGRALRLYTNTCKRIDAGLANMPPPATS